MSYNCKYCKGTGQVDISFGSNPNFVECLDCCLDCKDNEKIVAAGHKCLAAKYLDKFAAKFKSIDDIDAALYELGLHQYGLLWATLVEYKDEILYGSGGVWHDDEIDDEIARAVFVDNSVLELSNNRWRALAFVDGIWEGYSN